MRGRKKEENQNTYIVINEKLRIRIESDCLILESFVGNDNPIWGDYKYFTSWDGLFTYLIRKFTIEKLSKKELWSFQEARNEIVSATKETKSILLGEIESNLTSGKEEIKNAIKKFNH